MIAKLTFHSCLLSAILLFLFVLPLQAVASDLTDTVQDDLSSKIARNSTVADTPGEDTSLSTDDPSEAESGPNYSLPSLFSQTEIKVFVDVDERYRQSMAAYQVIEEDDVQTLDQADLTESIETGRRFSRDSLSARERIDQSKAQTKQALAKLLPSISLRGSRGYEISEPSVVVDPVTGELEDHSRHIRTDISLTATQPIFNVVSLLDWRRRKMREKVREEGYRATDGNAYVTTVDAYLNLVSTRLQADVMRDFEGELSELLTYIEKRAGAGAASVSDMSRVKARSQEAHSLRLEQESAHAAAGTEFVQLTNMVPKLVKLPEPKDVGEAMLPESFSTIVEEAMGSNPEIAALTTELEAAKVDMMASKAKFLPWIDAEYTDTYSLHAGGSPDSQRDKRVMLVANWNLVRGGADYHNYAERTARQSELKYKLDGQRRQVIQSLSASYAALEITRKRIVSGYEEHESISTAADAMSKRMLAGNQSLLDLLTVYDRRHQVRSKLVDLHIFEMKVVAQLVRMTYGVPWAIEEDEIPKIDQAYSQEIVDLLEGG